MLTERKSVIERSTLETKIRLELSIDGTGVFNGTTGIGFFDHMLTLMAKHGLLDITCYCEGDLYVDGHHTVEDIGICLGKAISQAIGDKKSIKRYSSVTIPMDEALVVVAMDISGRPYLHYDVELPDVMLGNFDIQLVEEFFRSLSIHCGMTIHICKLHGRNNHHIVEAIFKAFGRALDEATSIDRRINGIPSTKGMLE